MARHMTIEQLPYGKPVQSWLKDRYGETEANQIWEQTQQNADFAKKHDLLHVLPLLCNSDFFGISEIHGTLIRRGTCGNSDVCDYLVVGSDNPMAAEYVTVSDEQGFLVSRKRLPEKLGG